jgi:tRNA (cytidine/uridine-2'-O-)-methyltransferase
MFHIILFEPEIPPNTGNIIRLCANSGASLHLIHPLGFRLTDKYLKRAELDYQRHVTLIEHLDFENFLIYFRSHYPQSDLFAIETCGEKNYTDATLHSEDGLLFGSETKGLSAHVLSYFQNDHILRIPMRSHPDIRSINLSNTVAIVLYEAWRQNAFK